METLVGLLNRVYRVSQPFIYFAIAYLLLRYFDFSDRQRFGLIVFGWLLGRVLYDAATDPETRSENFVPFEITVEPNWKELLLDYKLISSDEDLQKFVAQTSELPEDDLRLFRQGFSFTVLTPNLIYFNDRRVFKTRVDFCFKIWQLTFAGSVGFSFHPSIYFSESAGDYQFGVITPESEKRALYPGDRMARLPVAILPCEAFESHWKKRKTLFSKWARKPNLAARGWTQAEKQSFWEDSVLTHKYVTVRHCGV